MNPLAGETEGRSLSGRLSTQSRLSPRKSIYRVKKKDIVRKKLSPRYRFRALVRKIINNLIFLSDESGATGGKKEIQLLSREELLFLKRPTRPFNELEALSRKLSYLKPFLQYSNEVRLQLLKLVTVEYYGEDRVIVRQGQDPQAMYFIVGGSVQSKTITHDPMFPEEEQQSVDKYMAGDTFGETSLLHREPHAGTVIALKSGVIVLILKKEYFQTVLQHTVQSQWDAIRWAMTRFQYFKKFPEEAKRLLCGVATFESKPPNTLMPVIDINGIEIATFVLGGVLRVIQRVLIETVPTSEIENRYIAFEEQKLDQSMLPDNVKPYYFETCKLHSQAVFGLGEIISKHHVMSDTDVFIMVIPRYVLFRYNYANVWNRAINIVNLNYPDLTKIIAAFVHNRRRIEYRKKTFNTMYRPKGCQSRLTMHDTSVSIRASTIRLSDAIQKTIASMPQFTLGAKIFSFEEYVATKKKFRRRTTLGRLY